MSLNFISYIIVLNYSGGYVANLYIVVKSRQMCPCGRNLIAMSLYNHPKYLYYGTILCSFLV